MRDGRSQLVCEGNKVRSSVPACNLKRDSYAPILGFANGFLTACTSLAPSSTRSVDEGFLRFERSGLRRKRMTGPVRGGGGPPCNLWRKLRARNHQPKGDEAGRGGRLTERRGKLGRRRSGLGGRARAR